MSVLIIVAIIVVVVCVLLYNRLVSLKNRCIEAWSDIDIQLNRRYDLIPNLVNTVKGYAKHEESVLRSVTEARNIAKRNHDETPFGARDNAIRQNELTTSLQGLLAVAENYPDLKASKNFIHLQEELVDIENRIQAARRFYNSNVLANNITIGQIPFNLIALVFTFDTFDFFQIAENERIVRQIVKVSL